MSKQKKKGFTLIELLAVIVVLAIILVIAVPKILEVIENARLKAYEDSVNLMIKQAHLDYGSKNVTGSKIEYPVSYEYGIDSDGETIQTNEKEVGLLNFKGDKPSEGTIVVDELGKVTVQNLVSKDRKFCAIKGAGEKNATVGRATELNCIEEPEKPVVDKVACELEKDKDTYYVDSVCDLYALSYEVNEGNTYEGKKIEIRNDLDMGKIDKNTEKYINKHSDYFTEDNNKKINERFTPIGNKSHPFSGILDGGANVIKNLTIDKQNSDYVGLFGYIDNGSILGLNIKKLNVTGSNNVGGLVGYVNSVNTKIKEIVLDDVNIVSNKYVGGVIGTSNADNIATNIILKNSTINRKEKGYSAGMLIGNYSNGSYQYSMIKNSIVYNVNMTTNVNQYIYTTSSDSNTYISNNSIINSNLISSGFDLKDYNDINFYETAGLDTWIGGDNDSSGYYFDYENDNSNNVVLKSAKKNPITFNLKKDNDDTYMIKSEKDWKEAVTSLNNSYKIMNNLNFYSKKFYMMGSYFNCFSGNLIGNEKSITNVSINSKSTNYVGIIGYGINNNLLNITFNNISIIGNNMIGLFGYFEGSKINEIFVNNVNINGNYDVGGIIGYSNKINLKTVIINGNVTGSDGQIGGIIGYNKETSYVDEVEITKMKVSGVHSVGGLNGWSNYGIKYNDILVKNIEICGKQYIFGTSPNNSDTANNTIFENLKIEGTTDKSIYTHYTNSSLYILNYSLTRNKGNDNETTSSETSDNINDINFYETAGLDTWIGGDNDSSGYYFDYENDNSNNIVLKSVKKSPITFNLSKDNDGIYLIKTEKDWKEATSNLSKSYKIINDLDFSKNKYYMMGSFNLRFMGNFNGNLKKISNITIHASKGNYIGVFGAAEGSEIKNINLNNVNINGNYDVGGIIGYSNKINLKTVIINGNVTGSDGQIGGIIGYSNESSYVEEVEITKMKVSGVHSVGGLNGWSTYGIRYNDILVKNIEIYGKQYIFGTSPNNSDTANNTIFENLKIEGTTDKSIYTHYTNSSPYILNYSLTRNKGNDNETNSSSEENKIYIGDLDYYTDKVETRLNGDKNNTGYYFDYVYSKDGIYLVNKYDKPESDDDTPSSQKNCKVTYGAEVKGCYRYTGGTHDGYKYRSPSSGELDDGNGAACTGTGLSAAFRKKAYYSCN